MIVRKGNVLLVKKIDELEKIAERLHNEKWELYEIKASKRIASFISEFMHRELEVKSTFYCVTGGSNLSP